MRKSRTTVSTEHMYTCMYMYMWGLLRLDLIEVVGTLICTCTCTCCIFPCVTKHVLTCKVIIFLQLKICIPNKENIPSKFRLLLIYLCLVINCLIFLTFFQFLHVYMYIRFFAGNTVCAKADVFPVEFAG